MCIRDRNVSALKGEISTPVMQDPMTSPLALNGVASICFTFSIDTSSPGLCSLAHVEEIGLGIRRRARLIFSCCLLPVVERKPDLENSALLTGSGLVVSGQVG